MYQKQRSNSVLHVLAKISIAFALTVIFPAGVASSKALPVGTLVQESFDTTLEAAIADSNLIVVVGDNAQADGSTITVEEDPKEPTNTALKMHFANAAVADASGRSLTLRVPIEGIPESGRLILTYRLLEWDPVITDTQENSGFTRMRWSNRGSIFNTAGNNIAFDYVSTSGDWGLNLMRLAGYATAGTGTTTVPPASGYVIGQKTLATRTWHTAEIILDLDTQLITYKLNGEDILGGASGKTAYMGSTFNDGSGYLLFQGYDPRIWTTFSHGGDLWLDDIEVRSVVPKVLPKGFLVQESFDTTLEAAIEDSSLTVVVGANAQTDGSTITVEEDPKEPTNTALKMHFANAAAADASGRSLTFRVPVEGIPESGSLVLTYRLLEWDPVNTDTSANIGFTRVRWSNRGSIFNTAGSNVAFDYLSTAPPWGLNEMRLSGYTAAGTGTSAIPPASGYIIGNKTALATRTWHTAEIILDLDTQLITYKINGEGLLGGASGKIAYMGSSFNDGSGYLLFQGYDPCSWTNGSHGGDFWLDDIEVKAFEPLLITTDMPSAGIDAASPLTVKFSNEVTDQAAVENAVTITRNSDNSVIASERISATLDGDNLGASITVDGDLEYNETEYTLAIADTFTDTNGMAPKSTFEHTFTTKFAKGMYVEPFAPVYSNTTTPSASTEVSAAVVIQNPTTVPAGAWVVLAAYGADNRMLGVSAATFDTIAASGSDDEVLTITGIDGTIKYIKAFAWDKVSKMTPYHMARTVELQ